MTAAPDAAVARKARRRFSADAALPSPLDRQCNNVPEEFWPTRRQFAAWGAFVHPQHVPDPNHWWYGWCPVHDNSHLQDDESAAPTAMFNWKFGVVRCLSNPDTNCHPGKRNATLTSVLERRAGVSDVAAGR